MAKKILNADKEIIGKLKVTDVPDGVGDFLTQDVNGNVTKRTATDTLVDIGAAPATHIHNYVHEQAIASDTWTVNHGLGKFSSVVVVDSANTVVMGQIDYVDADNVIITFNSAFTGFAYFN